MTCPSSSFAQLELVPGKAKPSPTEGQQDQTKAGHATNKPEQTTLDSSKKPGPDRVPFIDASPKEIYSTYCLATRKGDWKTAAKCLSEVGVERMFETAMKARLIVERVSKGTLPTSLGKLEIEKLKDWTEQLGEHYSDFEIGIDVNPSVARQLWTQLEPDRQQAFMSKFLKIYTGKTAPKAFRDRMKELWFAGRVRTKNRYEEDGEIVTMVASGKAQTRIEVSKFKDGWRLDGSK